jgi:hypothetical protein
VTRRVNKVQIEAEGRDKGKVFVITEMPALDGEYWAGRLLSMLAAGNKSVPAGLFSRGWEGAAAWIAVYGIGGIDWAVCKPLMDEMMRCVTVQPDPGRSLTRELVDSDIEEITTLMTLREAWFDTHVGFSVRARYWTSMTDTSTPQDQTGQNIATLDRARSAR